ncbi:glycosyl hydrolase [Streptomyces diastaticus]|uniref:glucan endo-1,3-beta-D-glucosidase n=2 Tax=Streptomyces TaxID=1883 RepID=A0A380P4U2_STRGR|nr:MULTISPECIES: glycosyl hydrolase [Streptomyces]NEE32836.1 glycoside hydrolase [Streptomyces sp. SID7982]WSU35142.1 glycosyl hydrolase [Streptomyces gougerotii]MBL3803833.1 glycoside hydrolase [Streptomyces sp. BRB081]QNE83752.1 glycoside hydrolase [Streptomyces rutgersensis]SUP59897.1 putative glycosyl hydrolase [Streptomyces griseus]
MPTRRSRPAAAMVLAAALAAVGLGPAATPAFAASVPVGAGSYSDTRPPGTTGPTTDTGTPVTPKVTRAAADKPVPTNDWWSSLAFQRYGDNPYSTPMYGHPLTYQAVSGGLEVGYPTSPTVVGEGRQYEYAHKRDLTLGLSGLDSPDTKADDWSDWTVTPYWSDGSRTLRTTIGHGLPFVYAQGSGGNAQITTAATPTVFSDQGNVLGITVGGHHYALFAPTGSDWDVSGTTISAGLGGKDYFSLAVLPSTDALATYRAYAFSFVTGSQVEWDSSAGTVGATYKLTTEAKEGTERGTLQALYRHQWLHTTDDLTPYTYVSPRGTMKVREGTSFTTSQKAAPVLPALPKTDAVDTSRLRTHLSEVADAPDPFSGATDTYWTGKALGKLAQLVPLADQIGETATRDKLVGLLQGRLQEWFTAGGASEFSYDKDWKTLTGHPASYGSDSELNDHHFHYGYYVYAAAIVAQYDPSWAEDSAWGGMVKELIRDTANPSRSDSAFPFLRGFDVYAGHSWASGHQGFAAGNNQESSSESTNLSAALVLWGSATGDARLRDLGSYLLATEGEAIAQYWFDADEEVFPGSFGHDTVGMVWGSGGAYSTWWTANPEEIHGINVLPVTAGGSLHLGGHKEAIRRNIAEMERENGGPAVEWRDILWEFESLADPAAAKAKWDAGHAGYTPEEGESKAHTYQWLTTLDALGAPDPSVTGDLPTSAVFAKGGDRTYVAHNHGSTERTVTFSDGHELTVPPRSTATGNGSGSGGQDPEPSTGNTFRLRSGGALTTGTGGASASDTVASSEGRNHDGTPNKPLVYEAKGVNATLKAGASTAFRLRVDAGTAVGLGQQARVSYDLTGDGTFDRTETYAYFATDPVPGWEEYTHARGLKSATGTLGDLRGGTVRLEVWNAIGDGTALLGTGGDTSRVVIPYE